MGNLFLKDITVTYCSSAVDVENSEDTLHTTLRDPIIVFSRYVCGNHLVGTKVRLDRVIFGIVLFWGFLSI